MATLSTDSMTETRGQAAAPSLLLLIPALNESEALPAVIREACAVPDVAEILVVDDGSDDGTPDRVAELARDDARVRLVRHPSRRGNGAAVKTGLRTETTATHAAVIDADGQHPPALLPALLERMRAEQLDMVVAARDFRSSGGGTPRALSNRFISACASWMLGMPIPDITSGYRVADLRLLRRFHRLYPEGFSFPLTSTVAFLQAGYRVGFVSYPGVSRQGGTSKISWWKDGRRFFIMLFRLSMWCPLRTFTPPALALLAFGTFWVANTVYLRAQVSAGGVLLLMVGLALLIGSLILQQIVGLRLDILSWLDVSRTPRNK